MYTPHYQIHSPLSICSWLSNIYQGFLSSRSVRVADIFSDHQHKPKHTRFTLQHIKVNSIYTLGPFLFTKGCRYSYSLHPSRKIFRHLFTFHRNPKCVFWHQPTIGQLWAAASQNDGYISCYHSNARRPGRSPVQSRSSFQKDMKTQNA